MDKDNERKMIRWYRRGWKAGAAHLDVSKDNEELQSDGLGMTAAYQLGWVDGKAAYRHAMATERVRLGLQPVPVPAIHEAVVVFGEVNCDCGGTIKAPIVVMPGHIICCPECGSIYEGQRDITAGGKWVPVQRGGSWEG